MAFITLILDKQAIETRFFPDQHLRIEGYLQGLAIDLLEQNSDLVELILERPYFKVEIIPKRITNYN